MSEEIPSIKKLLLENWLALKGQRRQGLHLTLHCKRRAVFEHLDPKPPAINERKIKYFLGGEIKHIQIQALLGGDWQCEQEVIYTTKSGVKLVAHPDAVWRKQDLVLEIKSTESAKVGHEPHSYHIK